MRNATRRITVPVAIVLALMAGPTLSGCSVNGLISGVTGGKVHVGEKKLPSDFPAEVPVAKGDVLLGASIGGAKGGDKAWNVTIRVAGATSFDDIEAQLTGAGFESTGGLGDSSEHGGTGAFTNGRYDVLVVVAKSGKAWSANYTVTTASQ
jgi:hypothetical protein